MKLHVRGQPMVEAMGFEFFGGNLGSKANLTPINGGEILPCRRDNVVGDLVHVYMKRRSQAIEDTEQTVLVHLKVVWPNRSPWFPIVLRRRLWES